MTYLGDAAVRARGLRTHLLGRDDLERLARTTTTGALAGALQSEGYWPAPSRGRAAGSAAESVDAAIEHEIGRRFALLARWLGDRRRHLAVVFEDEERQVVRRALRRVLERDGASPRAGAPSPAPFDRLDAASDIGGFVKALRRMGSPFASELALTRRAGETSARSLEQTIDRTFARRAARAASRAGGIVREYAADALDCENCWSALAGDADGFVAGGRALDRRAHASIAKERGVESRRRRLAEALRKTALRKVFDDPDLPMAALETRAISSRLEALRRPARIDPIGAAPILDLALRLAIERADLRRVNWGVAQGLPAPVIAEQLAAVRE